MDRFLEDLPIEDPIYEKFYLLVPVRFKEQAKQIISTIVEDTKTHPLQMDEVNNALYLFRGWIDPLGPNILTVTANESIPSMSAYVSHRNQGLNFDDPTINTDHLLLTFGEDYQIVDKRWTANFMLNTVQQMLDFSADINCEEQTRIALIRKTRKLIGIPNV